MIQKLKPNLVDPILNQKIIKTLKPTVPDYWEPTKKGCNTLYQKYVKPNLKFIIILLILIFILLYRYRLIKNRRLNKPKKIENRNDYSDYFINDYMKQKDEYHEKKINKKLKPLVYPIYPQHGDGVLIPNKRL